MMKSRSPKFKTWVEISRKAIAGNIKIMRSFLKPKTKLWAVVKSNAYGHGLVAFSLVANKSGVDGFCVDSVLEGLKLRENGIKKPVLVLGPTLPHLFEVAESKLITVTISNFEALNNFIKSKKKPKFHLKIDSGMHRQGFYLKDIPQVIKLFKVNKIGEFMTGMYTHFASAKDINYPTYTDMQFEIFQKAADKIKRADFSSKGGSASGGKNVIFHAAATGAIFINQKYHLGAVRSGIGLYGLWPSRELMIQNKDIKLNPVLSWHVLISEIKNLKKGDFVGYDLVERVMKSTKMAILPIGYWHGFPRSLSGIGEVLIKGRLARVLGRVSMDLVVVDVSGIDCKVGDRAVIVGGQNGNEISASDIAQKFGTTHYEFVTRINPLIERIIV